MYVDFTLKLQYATFFKCAFVEFCYVLSKPSGAMIGLN